MDKAERHDALAALLEELTAVPSVSGDEERIARHVSSRLEGSGVDVWIDRLGNVVAKKGSSPKIALFAHMDSDGFMVMREEEGLIELVRIGRPTMVHGARVVAWNNSQEVMGVVLEHPAAGAGGEPPRYVLDNGQQASFPVGTFVGFAQNFSRDGDVVISKALDNKVGLLVALKAFEAVDSAIFVGTTGHYQASDKKGARAAAHQVYPDAAVVCDVTYDENPLQRYHIRIGEGPALCLKDDLLPSRRMVKLAQTVASANGIKLQLEVLESGGSDAKAIFDVQGGIPFVFLGIPVRHMHSPNEIVHLGDIASAIDLVAGMITAFE